MKVTNLHFSLIQVTIIIFVLHDLHMKRTGLIVARLLLESPQIEVEEPTPRHLFEECCDEPFLRVLLPNYRPVVEINVFQLFIGNKFSGVVSRQKRYHIWKGIGADFVIPFEIEEGVPFDKLLNPLEVPPEVDIRRIM